jgi:hypothetical protein
MSTFNTVDNKTLFDTLYDLIQRRMQAYPSVRTITRKDLNIVAFDRLGVHSTQLTRAIMDALAQAVGGTYTVKHGDSRIKW